MLKLIAIRPLSGCRKSALKCLKADRMYYLCNDFTISDENIELRDVYVKILPDDFFTLPPKSKLNLNISAIVGMNGDGKSSLIELMMRLINNCAKHYRLTYKENLMRIEGIKAELYYLLDNVIYCIREAEKDKYTSLEKCAELGDMTARKWKHERKKVENVGSMEELFYTLVSNYSLYAYNTLDFREEWNNNLKVSDENEKCWLHYLFHKNDGYRTPMTIHPYRYTGNIDVNRENDLTIQRLVALYIQEEKPDVNPNSFRCLGEKYADSLLLADTGHSNLQKYTLIEYFEMAKKVSVLGNTTRRIEDLIVKYSDIEYERLYDDTLEVIEECLDFLTGIDDKQYHGLIEKFSTWMLDRKRRRMFSSNSDIRMLLNAMRKYDNKELPGELPYKRFAHKYNKFDKFNVRQLARLRLVFEVMKCWEIPIDILLKNYDDLSETERCLHYIVYKTINIFETYPVYIDLIENNSNGWNGLIFKRDYDVVATAVSKIKEEPSHITLKIRQCLSYIWHLDNHPDFLKNIAEKESVLKVSDNFNEYLLLKFDSLKNFYKEEGVFRLECLPPPIYKYEIIYRHQNSEKDYIPFRFLSSGEKQLLNNIGAILYHLRNLDSVSDNNAKCENVNIVLEEIELYFHPEYQRSIIKMLIEKLNGANFNYLRNIQITFVTHSPYILSDIPKQNVLFLKDGAPYYEMQENTFGANINSLLKNGFFLPGLPMGEFAYSKINTIFAILHSGKFDQTELDQLYAQIMTVGEPAIRMQLMTLFSPYRIFSLNKEELVENLRQLLSNDKR